MLSSPAKQTMDVGRKRGFIKKQQVSARRGGHSKSASQSHTGFADPQGMKRAFRDFLCFVELAFLFLFSAKVQFLRRH